MLGEEWYLPGKGELRLEKCASFPGRERAWAGTAEAGGAWEGRAEAGGALASPGGRANAGGRVVLAWERRAVAVDALASPGGRANAGGVVLAWEGTVPSLGGGIFLRRRVGLGRSDSFPRGVTWELFKLHEAKLFVQEAKLLVLVLLDLVIFPSFLIVSKFSLFNCLSLTLLNLVSPTLSTKSWHSLSFCVETIVTSFDLHSSNCLEVWSRM